MPKKKQKGVRKNEEIQALDYKFAVESEANSEWDESQSVSAATEPQQNGKQNNNQ